jgi:Fe-S-cluster containining protein
MTHLPIYVEYTDLTMCQKCGGECCTDAPGISIPEDFGAPDEELLRRTLRERLATGRWTIETYLGSATVRPAVRGYEGHVHDTQYQGGTCTFWSQEKGCEIFDQRPMGCRILEPWRDIEGGLCCNDHGVDLRNAWQPYHALLRELLQE